MGTWPSPYVRPDCRHPPHHALLAIACLSNDKENQLICKGMSQFNFCSLVIMIKRNGDEQTVIPLAVS